VGTICAWRYHSIGAKVGRRHVGFVETTWRVGSKSSAASRCRRRCCTNCSACRRSDRWPVTNATHSHTYDPSVNHDPELDSNGTTIQILKPS